MSSELKKEKEFFISFVEFECIGTLFLISLILDGDRCKCTDKIQGMSIYTYVPKLFKQLKVMDLRQCVQSLCFDEYSLVVLDD